MENLSDSFRVESLVKLSTDLATRSAALKLVEIAIIVLLNTISVFGNILVCIAVYRNLRLRNVTSIFVITLALSDLAMGCFAMPITSGILIYGKFPYARSVCYLHGFCIFTFAIFSLETLCAIAINRYFCVVKPQHYSSFFTLKRAFCYIMFAFSISLTCSIPPLLTLDIHYAFQPGKAMCLYPFESSLSFTLFLEIVCINIPLAIIAMCYFKVYKVVRDANRTFAQNNRGQTGHSTKQLSANVEEAKVTKTLVAVLIGFVSCWLPISVVDIIDVVMGAPTLPRQLYLTYALLAYTSSTINPFIYGVFNRTFRKEFKKILVCVFRLRKNQVMSDQDQRVAWDESNEIWENKSNYVKYI